MRAPGAAGQADYVVESACRSQLPSGLSCGSKEVPDDEPENKARQDRQADLQNGCSGYLLTPQRAPNGNPQDRDRR